MPFSKFRLPSRLSYSLFIFAQILEIICRIVLIYSAMILILFIPVSISLLQWGSAMIEKPVISQELRHQYAQDAVGIIMSGKVYTATYNVDEISHLLDVRKVLFIFVIIAIVVLAIFFYLRLNKPQFLLLRSSVVLRNTAIIIALFTILVAVFFQYFFVLMHTILFPQGNYVFPVNSPLIEAFPLSYWLLTFLCLQIGAFLVIALQAWFAHRQEV